MLAHITHGDRHKLNTLLDTEKAENRQFAANKACLTDSPRKVEMMGPPKRHQIEMGLRYDRCITVSHSEANPRGVGAEDLS
jgi:hypothetical protein